MIMISGSFVKGNHANPDSVQTFSFATLYRMATRHDSQWRIQSFKDTFEIYVSELEFCAYFSAICSYAPAQSTIYFFPLTNKY